MNLSSWSVLLVLSHIFISSPLKNYYYLQSAKCYRYSLYGYCYQKDLSLVKTPTRILQNALHFRRVIQLQYLTYVRVKYMFKLSSILSSINIILLKLHSSYDLQDSLAGYNSLLHFAHEDEGSERLCQDSGQLSVRTQGFLIPTIFL